MNEGEWLTCTNPQMMLSVLRGNVSERKLRLFAVACCRCHRGVLRGKRNLQVLEDAEAYADGRISRKEMEEKRRAWYAFDYPFPLRGTWQMALSHATMVTRATTLAPEAATHAAAASDRPERERLIQAGLLRDIFFPFRVVSFDACLRLWSGGAAVALATEMYESRDFTRAPLLADMLEDGGASDAQLLEHLRGPGPHVRGCWLVDLLLGKA